MSITILSPRKILATLVVLLSLAIPTYANAGLLIEPYFGYILSGDGEIDGSSDSYSGTNIGARLGYTFLGLMGGLEYSLGSHELDTSGGLSMDTTDMSLFVGYELPILLRAWLSYSISSDGTLEYSGSSSDTELSGGGYTLGIGYTGFPFISLNFEMFNRVYDDCSFTGVSNCKETILNNKDFTVDGYALSISVPLP